MVPIRTVQEILAAMSKRSAQNIAGYTWQQDRTFSVAEQALSNDGTGGILGALLLTGGNGGSGMGSAIMQPRVSFPGQLVPAAPSGMTKEIFCSRCAKKFSSSAKFCPHCGDPYLGCPKCGTDNDEKAKRCVTCATQLGAGHVCPKCSASIAARCGRRWPR